MKCVILAAGEGIRMRPLTIDTPKCMLLLSGKPLLEHIIAGLPDEVDELILVVGYLQEKIRSHFGAKFGRFAITYVEQKEKQGTYRALELCKDFLDDEKFLMLYADDIHGKKSLLACVHCEDPCLVVAEAEDPRRFGVIELNSDGSIKNIEEKPEHPKSNLVSTGVLVLDASVFHYPPPQHPNGEYYLTDSLARMIDDGKKIYTVMSDLWIPINTPQDLKAAESRFSS